MIKFRSYSKQVGHILEIHSMFLPWGEIQTDVELRCPLCRVQIWILLKHEANQKVITYCPSCDGNFMLDTFTWLPYVAEVIEAWVAPEGAEIIGDG